MNIIITSSIICFQNRQHLLSLHPDNETTLNTMQTSIFNLALDDARPTNIEEVREGVEKYKFTVNTVNFVP